MRPWLSYTANALGLLPFRREIMKICAFMRDAVWTTVFYGVAVTVAHDYSLAVRARGGCVRCRVLYRLDGRLNVRIDPSDPSWIAHDVVEVAFADRGIAWVPGHDGLEVDALRAAVALAVD